MSDATVGGGEEGQCHVPFLRTGVLNAETKHLLRVQIGRMTDDMIERDKEGCTGTIKLNGYTIEVQIKVARRPGPWV